MSELYLLFVVTLLAATVLATIACASIGRSRLRAKRNLAKVCRCLGIAVVGIGIVGMVSGILTIAATAAPGLTESDRTRMWSNGLIEVGYNVLLALVVAIPALLVAGRSSRSEEVSR